MKTLILFFCLFFSLILVFQPNQGFPGGLNLEETLTTYFTSETYVDQNNTPVEKWKLSDARPNPAKDHTWIHYTLPDDAQNAQITIRNLVGTTVHTENLIPGNDRFRLNTSDLTNGIYIYSLILDNQLVKSKRLVVAK
jgi:hypothetical protein